MSSADSQPLNIDVVSDIVCPWCFIGKRQLEQALAMRQNRDPQSAPAQLSWHPFQLNPELPAEGLPRAQYLKAKFGESTGGDVYSKVLEAGASVDLDLKIDKIERQPNTIRAHALIAMAQDARQDKLVELMFDAFFMHGEDLGEDGVLIELGRQAGLAEPVIESALSDESVHQSIRAADKQAREFGITGVPFIIFNQRLAVSGAAGAETLLAAADKALAGDADDRDEPDPTNLA